MPKEEKLEAISGHMRIYWIVSSTFYRFLPCILVHLTHGYRLRKSGGAYLPHSLVIKDVNTGYTALIIPIHDHFRLIDNQDSDSTSIFSGASKSPNVSYWSQWGFSCASYCWGLLVKLCTKQCGKQTKGLRTVKVSSKGRMHMFHSFLSTGISRMPSGAVSTQKQHIK